MAPEDRGSRPKSREESYLHLGQRIDPGEAEELTWMHQHTGWDALYQPPDGPSGVPVVAKRGRMTSRPCSGPGFALPSLPSGDFSMPSASAFLSHGQGCRQQVGDATRKVALGLPALLLLTCLLPEDRSSTPPSRAPRAPAVRAATPSRPQYTATWSRDGTTWLSPPAETPTRQGLPWSTPICWESIPTRRTEWYHDAVACVMHQ